MLKRFIRVERRDVALKMAEEIQHFRRYTGQTMVVVTDDIHQYRMLESILNSMVKDVVDDTTDCEMFQHSVRNSLDNTFIVRLSRVDVPVEDYIRGMNFRSAMFFCKLPDPQRFYDATAPVVHSSATSKNIYHQSALVEELAHNLEK